MYRTSYIKGQLKQWRPFNIKGGQGAETHRHSNHVRTSYIRRQLKQWRPFNIEEEGQETESHRCSSHVHCTYVQRPAFVYVKTWTYQFKMRSFRIAKPVVFQSLMHQNTRLWTSDRCSSYITCSWSYEDLFKKDNPRLVRYIAGLNWFSIDYQKCLKE